MTRIRRSFTAAQKADASRQDAQIKQLCDSVRRRLADASG